MHISYSVVHRVNIHCKDSTEWALNVSINTDTWTIFTWEGKKSPKDEDVQNAIRISKKTIAMILNTIKLEKVTFD